MQNGILLLEDRLAIEMTKHMRWSMVAHACNSMHNPRCPEAEPCLGCIPRSYLEKPNNGKYKGKEKEKAEEEEKRGEKN